MHRRVTFSVFHSAFKWCDSLTDGELVAWDRVARAEVAIATLMLPVAESNIAWPIADWISTTDATLTRGGATAAWCNQELAETLYRVCETRGCRVRLRSWREGPTDLLPTMPEVEHLVGAMTHQVSRATPCQKARHINLQEIDEATREIEIMAGDGCLGVRRVNGTDSNVSLGARAKGRSG